MKNRKYKIITIGCQMNKSDSERISAFFKQLGLTESRTEKADFIIINTCGVRQSAEDRIFGLIPKFKKDDPAAKIILTGCLSEREDVKKKLAQLVDLWLPIGRFDDLELFINDNEMAAGESKKTLDYLSFGADYSSKIMAFVPIGNGCNNFCSYCVVPYARGRERYRHAEEIIAEVAELVKKDYKEINLIAQNVNSYHDKEGYDFSRLLQKLNEIPGEFWIRFATSHPKDMSDSLIKTIAECRKVCEHVHLPVQAGDNKILELMNRGYTQQDYLKLIAKIRGNIPEVAISTDIIVGFPGESEKMFAESLALARVVRFDQIYIAQYSPRPGTAAAKLEDNVGKSEKKSREKRLTEIFEKGLLENNQTLVGRQMSALVIGRNKNGLIARLRNNKTVMIDTPESKLIGHFIEVKITKARTYGLSAIIE